MIRRNLMLSLAIRSPFLFAGETIARFGVDSAALRDEAGRPLVPAEQVRGVLRAACLMLSRHAPAVLREREVADLFGSESTKDVALGEQDRPDRGCLLLPDLTAMDTLSAAETTRIEIDDESGAVRPGAMQVIELVAPPGAEVTFTGVASFTAVDGKHADRLADALKKASVLIPAIGSAKSAGFGEVIRFAITWAAKDDRVLVVPAVQRSNASTSAKAESVALRRAYALTLDRPFLVDAVRVTDNLYAGAEVIPGAALKGALAAKLKLCGHDPETDDAWGTALAQLRISHAFPENDGDETSGVSPTVSGLPIPYSALAAKGEDGWTFGDGLCAPADAVPMLGERTPATPMDWKPGAFEAFADGVRFPRGVNVRLLPRMHVAIDDRSQSALDQKLFGTLRRSQLTGGARAPRRWRVVADIGQVEDQELGLRLIALLESGLDGLGRTAATVSFQMHDAHGSDKWSKLRATGAPAVEAVSPGSTLYAVTLLTPAVLIDMGTVAQREDRRIRYEDYASFWNATCGGTLKRSFATTRLAGGYIAVRRRVFGQRYYPFVLTEPGSCFLVENPNLEKLGTALRFGLRPPPQSGVGSLTWRNCNYVPESGFGEIALNLIDHHALGQVVTHV